MPFSKLEAAINLTALFSFCKQNCFIFWFVLPSVTKKSFSSSLQYCSDCSGVTIALD